MSEWLTLRWRNSFLKYLVINTETCMWSACRAQEMLGCSAFIGMSLSQSPLKAQRSMQRRERNVYKSPRRYMILRKQSLPDTAEQMHLGTHRDDGSEHRTCASSSQDRGVGAGMKSPLWPRSYCQQIAARIKKVNFLQWSDTGHISCTQGRSHAQE